MVNGWFRRKPTFPRRIKMAYVGRQPMLNGGLNDPRSGGCQRLPQFVASRASYITVPVSAFM